MRVSVVIPTRNGAERLPIVLDALARQTLPASEFEVVVSDDGSDDGTAEVAARYPFVRVTRATRSAGAPAASNAGLAAARSPVIAFTDDDTVPDERWLELGLAALHRSVSGVVAGHVELQLGAPPTTAELVDLGRGYLDQRAYVEEGYGATANLWVRRDVLEALDGFDERYLGQGHDRDFGERAARAGYPVEYAADVIVAHPARRHPRDLARVAFRLGKAHAELRALGGGRLADLRPPHRRLAYLRPWASIWGLDRVRARGYRPSIRQRAAMYGLQYVCFQLPMVAGSARVALRRER